MKKIHKYLIKYYISLKKKKKFFPKTVEFSIDFDWEKCWYIVYFYRQIVKMLKSSEFRCFSRQIIIYMNIAAEDLFGFLSTEKF